MVSKMFGELFKELRLEKGYTLRSYCRKYDEDPPYISRLERGLTPPPNSQDHITKMALSFDLIEKSDECEDFFLLASVSSGKNPESIMSDEAVLSKLPLLLRSVDGSKIKSENIYKLIELIRNSWIWLILKIPIFLQLIFVKELRIS